VRRPRMDDRERGEGMTLDELAAEMEGLAKALDERGITSAGLARVRACAGRVMQAVTLEQMWRPNDELVARVQCARRATPRR
jgi:hypothetical protein